MGPLAHTSLHPTSSEVVRAGWRVHGPTGAEFEKRILVNEKNNVKFNFLVPSDPYHAYYRMRVRQGA